MIEAGVNVRVESRYLFSKQFNAISHDNDQIDEGRDIIIVIKFFRKFFKVLLYCLMLSLLAYIIEVSFSLI